MGYLVDLVRKVLQTECDRLIPRQGIAEILDARRKAHNITSETTTTHELNCFVAIHNTVGVRF